MPTHRDDIAQVKGKGKDAGGPVGPQAKAKAMMPKAPAPLDNDDNVPVKAPPPRRPGEGAATSLDNDDNVPVKAPPLRRPGEGTPAAAAAKRQRTE